MTKVLYLLNHAGKAGTERYVQTLASYLRGKHIEPFFAYHEDGLLVERMLDLGVPTAQLPMKGRFDRKAAEMLAALCQRWKIDLIHTHFLREHYIALMAKQINKNLRVVYTNHFVMKNDLLTRVSNRYFDKRQDQIIAVCNRGKQQLVQNGWREERITVVHNGVDLDAWAGGESTLRKEFNIPADRFVMLCASRLAQDKGHAYLIRSLRRLTEICDVPFTMVLAGDGPLLDQTLALAGQLNMTDKIIFTGFRRDIKNLYKGSDLYINSSEHEALSFLIIEAMAAGLPAIITDMGGNRDIIDEHSGGGILVKYDDPESMARAMKRLIEHPDKLAACRARAYEIVAEKFEVSKMCEDTWAVYQKALAR